MANVTSCENVLLVESFWTTGNTAGSEIVDRVHRIEKANRAGLRSHISACFSLTLQATPLSESLEQATGIGQTGGLVYVCPLLWVCLTGNKATRFSTLMSWKLSFPGRKNVARFTTHVQTSATEAVGFCSFYKYERMFGFFSYTGFSKITKMQEARVSVVVVTQQSLELCTSAVIRKIRRPFTSFSWLKGFVAWEEVAVL